MPHSGSRPTRLLILLLTALVAMALGLGSFGATTARAATQAPAVPSGLPAGIESLSSYVPAVTCSPTARPGTVKLGKLLTSTYPGTTFGGSRVCGPSANSEHHEGRAVDWMNNIRVAKEAEQAKAVLSWLFATDKQGNPYANARRLGVMYIIWNNKIWAAYSPDRGWREYNGCSTHPEKSWDNTCHRNHMHISLSWSGATGVTSYWTKKVSAPDYGRCRPADLNWSYSYEVPRRTPCPRYAKVTAPAGSSTLMKNLVTYSGRYLKQGYTGTPVKIIQQATRTTVDGSYGPTTVNAVKTWQRAHGVTASGTINHETWRALLKANKPTSSTLGSSAKVGEDEAFKAMTEGHQHE